MTKLQTFSLSYSGFEEGFFSFSVITTELLKRQASKYSLVFTKLITTLR